MTISDNTKHQKAIEFASNLNKTLDSDCQFDLNATEADLFAALDDADYKYDEDSGWYDATTTIDNYCQLFR